jgi:putative Ca2+/H+ antiporter (TMEM165/GDT1 family)
MEAFLVSVSVVALAEMGDKTQLLAFALAAKLRHRVPIVLGILVATLANHFLAGWIGVWLATLVAPGTLRWAVAVSFLVFGLWTLKADELAGERHLHGAGVFVTTVTSFFLIEIGDKTQLATVALAARFDSLVPVVMGTTLGMMIADAPAVWVGEALSRRINMKWMRWVAAALFILLGGLTVLAGEDAMRVSPGQPPPAGAAGR